MSVEASPHPSNPISAVILAAGASRRLGFPKQTLELGGETLIRRAVRIAIEAQLSPVIVVLRQIEYFAIELQQTGCLLVVNDDADEGMASSIRHGVFLAKTLKAPGVVIMSCDQVALRPGHLVALIANPKETTGSRYADKVGIPAYFPAIAFPALLKLKGDVGARAILSEAAAIENEDLALDIDTEADVLAARERFQL
jgi:molybdenum cofactor cytidylyltransferase